MDPMFGSLGSMAPMVTSSLFSNGIFTKGVPSLQNWHNWRQSANHPGEKIIAKCHLEFSYFFICTATGIILYSMELVNFSHKYSIWTRGGRRQKVPNAPQTLDPFTEWLNFMFKYTNIYLKKIASSLQIPLYL